MRRRMVPVLLTLLPGCVFGPPFGSAVERTLRVRLLDEQGAPLAGAAVTLEEDDGTRRLRVADVDGIVRFSLPEEAITDNARVRIGFADPLDPRIAVPAGLRLVYHAGGDGVAIEEHAISIPAPRSGAPVDSAEFRGWISESIVPSDEASRFRTSPDGHVEVVVDPAD